MSSRRRLLLAAPLCAAAFALPAAAHATTVTYDVSVASSLKADVTGSAGYWNSTLTASTDLDQTIEGLTVTDDRYPVMKVAEANRFSAGRITQRVTEDTAMGTLEWNCALVGEMRGEPGEVIMTAEGDDVLVRLTVARAVEATRRCTGYSDATVTDRYASEPLQATFRVPKLELAGGTVYRPIDLPVRCAEDLIPFQEACGIRWRGGMVIRATSGLPEEPETPRPAPPTGTTPPPATTPAGPRVPAPAPKVLGKVKGKLAKGGKVAKVSVQCRSACSGTVTATAVAQRRALATRSFTQRSAGTRTVEVLVGSRGRQAARGKGLVIEVGAGGQSSRTTLRLR